MTRFLGLALLVLSSTALAVEGVSLTPTSPSDPPLFGLSVATASAVSLASSVGATGIALGIGSACTAQLGSPRPLCSAAGVLVGGGVQLLLTWLVLPEAFRISGLDPTGIRAGWWRWARWPAAMLAVTAAVLLGGAASEQDRYGSAQGTMIGGLAGTVTSGLTLDVLGVIGAVRAAKERR